MKIKNLFWKIGETVILKPWLLNDSPNMIPGGEGRIRICGDNNEIAVFSFKYGDVSPRTNYSGDEFSFDVPYISSGTLDLYIESEINSDWNSEYLIYVHE